MRLRGREGQRTMGWAKEQDQGEGARSRQVNTGTELLKAQRRRRAEDHGLSKGTGSG